ncbi:MULTISPECIES: NAD(+) diphosphatase [unclassified Achromobacter]|uniref:NAD(+) diphosphatase n=1 Tax=unclassified Achromobacter TaxID=2626865 RepID=UPI000B5190EA|nr:MULTISPECIES: NAD(+) diphosphatase [unclassified Achromobacter]OWT74580.1 NADH pyrophosphatase [Achromobacter sp. HZ34]OWT79047.1 NADH pyrophosphatase [Achromobacter sp. HZ28]
MSHSSLPPSSLPSSPSSPSSPSAGAPNLAPAALGAYLFAFRGGELLVREDGAVLPLDDIRHHLADAQADWHTVGSHRGQPCLALALARDSVPPAGYVFRRLREVMGELEATAGALAGRAFQVAEWARTHRYCGVCATPTERVAHEFCLKCPNCGHSNYPRISPAMMVLIKKGDSILLARNANFAAARYSALAGFVEAGESLEETVHREVQEEVGLRVHQLRYFQSQSWPFPHSLMLAFTAEYLDGDIQVDGTEIIDAQWYGPGDTLPNIPPTDSVAGRLIRANLPGK